MSVVLTGKVSDVVAVRGNFCDGEILADIAYEVDSELYLQPEQYCSVAFPMNQKELEGVFPHSLSRVGDVPDFDVKRGIVFESGLGLFALCFGKNAESEFQRVRREVKEALDSKASDALETVEILKESA